LRNQQALKPIGAPDSQFFDDLEDLGLSEGLELPNAALGNSQDATNRVLITWPAIEVDVVGRAQLGPQPMEILHQLLASMSVVDNDSRGLQLADSVSEPLQGTVNCKETEVLSGHVLMQIGLARTWLTHEESVALKLL
jgi:hypothetical protein